MWPKARTALLSRTRLTKECCGQAADHPIKWESAISIFFWQQNTRRRTIRFCNHPNLDPRNTERVHGHQPESLLKRKLVFFPVVLVYFSPITGLMAAQVGRKVVARYPNCCQGTGRRDHLTECEEQLHALPFSASAAWKCLASTPALARCAQVIVYSIGSHSPDKIQSRRQRREVLQPVGLGDGRLVERNSRSLPTHNGFRTRNKKNLFPSGPKSSRQNPEEIIE
jgi:hypothetical protein